MRTVFVHGEIDQYTETKGVLTARFREWCAAKGGEVPTGLTEFLLDDKLVRDGLLTRWTEPGMEAFLVESVPRRMVLDGRWSVIPEYLHLWVDFLDDAELLVLGDSAVPELHAAIERAAPVFLAAMAEPAEWGPEKFWVVTMREHQVDQEDENAVEGFHAAIEDGEIEVDESVVDDIEERDALERTSEPAFWLPPAAVPEEEAPAIYAPGTEILGRMRALHEWVGAGRQLDADGEPDASEVDDLIAEAGLGDHFEAEILIEWAKHADLVRVVSNRLVPTQISTGLLAEPGLLWTRLWQCFLLLDELFGAEAAEAGLPAEGAETFLGLVQEALCRLYSQTEEVPLELLVDLSLRSLREDAGLSAEHGESAVDDVLAQREVLRRTLRRVLGQWESMGAVRRFVTSQDEQLEVIDEAVLEGVEPDHTMLELTPLGMVAARGSVQAFGFIAPTVDEMVHHSAEVLVLATPAGSPDVIEEVLTAWIDQRGARQASSELAALLHRVDDPAVRLTALSFLEHTGQDGVTAALGLCEDPLAGPAVRMWLRTRPIPEEIPTRPGDELMFSLDGMAITAIDDADSFLIEFREQPTTDQIALIDDIPRTNHAKAGTVLEVIAEGHPDERVAGAARRSLEKVRG